MVAAWAGGGESGRKSLPCTGVRAPLLRVHELEEMVKDQETTAEQALEEEARRHREAYSKLERERSTEIELLNTRWARGMAQCPPPSDAPSHPGLALWAGAVPIVWMGKLSPKGKPPVNLLLILEHMDVFSRKQVKECS